MNNSLIVFNEPELEFRFGQRVRDPHDGLGLFGPYDTDQSSQPGTLTHIILGPPDGIERAKEWSNKMSTPCIEAPNGNLRLWPPFPGFDAAFCAKWPSDPVWSYPIDRDSLLEASRLRDPHERAYSVVNLYLEGLDKTPKLDEKIGVAICVVPDDVWLNCRPESRVLNPVGAPSLSRTQKTARKAGQIEMYEEYEPEQYHLSPDFRRQLKARSMKYGIPLQILRESVLRLGDEKPVGERTLTPLSDRLWNISTTLYYKCGGKPWRLVTARDGVCYIGIAFRRTDKSENGRTACCAAQMFLNTGDGIVFLGDEGLWYSPKSKQFHLSRTAAKNLLAGVLKTYQDLGGKKLTEIFLHSRSSIGVEEFGGYVEACPDDVKLVGVRVRTDRYGPRLYRDGNMPVIRGTFLRASERSGFLWGAGFKPRLATYDGWETPAPLRIDVQHGEAPIERVAQDIFGLTKLNYNACRLGDAQPVTVKFSNAVGEILVSNPTVKDRRPNFKFYI